MTKKASAIKELRQCQEDFDLFLLDLWGVIHDGVTAFPHAHDALIQLQKHKKTVALISNAPRRINVIAAQLKQFGIAPELYDAIFSSGEATWHDLKQRGTEQLGHFCYHIGPKRDHHLLNGLPFKPTDNINDADFILNSGPWGDSHRLEDYHELLDEAHKCALLMVCANPDHEVIRGGKRLICAGALAHAYENRGGRVIYHGKPHAAIYQTIENHYAHIAKERILAIGDSIITDIKGAHRAGIDAILITGGIHHAQQGNIAALLRQHDLMPLALMERLAW